MDYQNNNNQQYIQPPIAGQYYLYNGQYWYFDGQNYLPVQYEQPCQPQYPVIPQKNICAILALVFGIVSPVFGIMCFVFIGEHIFTAMQVVVSLLILAVSIAAFILGIIGIIHARRKKSGKAMAVVGLVFGIVTAAYSFLMSLFFWMIYSILSGLGGSL